MASDEQDLELLEFHWKREQRLIELALYFLQKHHQDDIIRQACVKYLAGRFNKEIRKDGQENDYTDDIFCQDITEELQTFV